MKFLGLIAFAMFASTTLCLAEGGPRVEPGPVQEVDGGKEVIRALISNPELYQTLQENSLYEISKFTRQGLKPGLTRYFLRFETCGNCLPNFADVSILEDLTPTYSDGPIRYTIKVNMK